MEYKSEMALLGRTTYKVAYLWQSMGEIGETTQAHKMNQLKI